MESFATPPAASAGELADLAESILNAAREIRFARFDDERIIHLSTSDAT